MYENVTKDPNGSLRQPNIRHVYGGKKEDGLFILDRESGMFNAQTSTGKHTDRTTYTFAHTVACCTVEVITHVVVCAQA